MKTKQQLKQKFPHPKKPFILNKKTFKVTSQHKTNIPVLPISNSAKNYRQSEALPSTTTNEKDGSVAKSVKGACLPFNPHKLKAILDKGKSKTFRSTGSIVLDRSSKITNENDDSIAKSVKGTVLPFNPHKLKAILDRDESKTSRPSGYIVSGRSSSNAVVMESTEFFKSKLSNKSISTAKKEPFNADFHPYSSSIIQEKAVNRLCSAKFRFINEKLYTSTGAEALQLFKTDPSSFKFYHDGFEQQVEKWPLNPVDMIIEDLKHMPQDLIIADFGCGDAKIARTFPERTVHSFDLFALNEFVTVADMAKVPSANASVDICVFCLSLMGTNLTDYLHEASRILKLGGVLKIAEVQSRFENADTFKTCMKAIGFRLKKEDWSQTMFALMDFKKKRHAPKKSKIPVLQLSPCFYKRR